MGIIMGIVSFVFGLCINLLDAAIVGFLDVFDFDMTTLYAVFPFAENVKDVFVACGLTLLMLGLMWQLFKGFGMPFGIEAENPVTVVVKVALSWFAVVNASHITDMITVYFSVILETVSDAPLGVTWDVDTMISQLASSVIAACSDFVGIIYLIIIVALGWKFLKLLIEVIERYIVYCFICFMAPIFLATAAFKSTKNIAETWVKAFFGQSLLIVLNVWSVRMFMSFCFILNSHFATAGVTTANGKVLSPLILGLMGAAFLNFAMRIDSFLRILGLNTAHTGSSLMQSLGGGIMKTIAMAKTIQALGPNRGAAKAGAATGNERNPAANGAAGNVLGGIGSPGASANGEQGATAGGVGPDMGSARGTAAGVAASVQNDGVDGAGGVPIPGSGKRGVPRVMEAESTLMGLRGKQGSMNSEYGPGATNQFKSMQDKMAYAHAGMSASMGRQQQLADNNIGTTDMGSSLKQDKMTSDAVRAAATSAEINPETGMPIASYKNGEAAAAMNGVLAFGNNKVSNFAYKTDEDGGNYIAGMDFKDGSSVTFDSVQGGVASGTFTSKSGETTEFDLIHDNAVSAHNTKAAAGVEGYSEFTSSASVGRVGDGSGSGGYYVVPKTHQGVDVRPVGSTTGSASTYTPEAVENMQTFISNSNPVTFKAFSYDESMIERQRSQANTRTPSPRPYSRNATEGGYVDIPIK